MALHLKSIIIFDHIATLFETSSITCFCYLNLILRETIKEIIGMRKKMIIPFIPLTVPSLSEIAQPFTIGSESTKGQTVVGFYMNANIIEKSPIL